MYDRLIKILFIWKDDINLLLLEVVKLLLYVKRIIVFYIRKDLCVLHKTI